MLSLTVKTESFVTNKLLRITVFDYMSNRGMSFSLDNING